MRTWCGLMMLTATSAAFAQPSAVKPADMAVQRDLDRAERIVLTGKSLKAFITAVAAKRVSNWQKSAERGEAAGQYLLALAHVYGAAVSHDDAAAVKLYERAAAQGLAVARFTLSGRYASGKGVPVNEARSRELMQQAADQGFAPALGELGRDYRNGFGVEKNAAKADDYFRRAAAAGSVFGRLGWAVMHDAAFRAPDADPKLPDPVNEIRAIGYLRALTFEKSFKADDKKFAANVTAEASSLARGEFRNQRIASPFAQDQYLAAILAADPENAADLSRLGTEIADAVVAGFKQADVGGGGLEAVQQVSKLEALGKRLDHAVILMERLRDQPELIAENYDQMYQQAVKNCGEKSFVVGEFARAAAAQLREGGFFEKADTALKHALAVFERSPEVSYVQRADCLLERAELRRCQARPDEVRTALNEATRLLAKLYHWQVKNYDPGHYATKTTRIRLLFAAAMAPLGE